MNREFLKEAIADAKAVKETAIANAKAALEESFTPHLKSVLSAKLEEMEKEDMDEGYDEMDEAKDSEKMEEKKEYMTAKEKREGDDRKSDNKAETETEKMRKIKEEDDSDLDEVLAELKDELDEDKRTDAEEEGYKDGLKDEKEDLMKEDDRTDAEEEGYEDGMEDEKEDLEDEEIDLDDMTDEDLKSFIEDVISDMVAAGEIEAGDEFEVEDEVEVDDEVEVEDDVDVTIDEDARTDAEEEGYKDGIKDAKADAKKAIEDIKLEEEKEDELKEAYATVETLRNELNEINLLNAKLLYTNKIFKSKNLSENNKVKVLTSFDKADTVKEAKLIYETLKDGLAEKKAKKTVNESISMASKSIGMGPKKVNAKPIVESNVMVDRFKKLAGII